MAARNQKYLSPRNGNGALSVTPQVSIPLLEQEWIEHLTLT